MKNVYSQEKRNNAPNNCDPERPEEEKGVILKIKNKWNRLKEPPRLVGLTGYSRVKERVRGKKEEN